LFVVHVLAYLPDINSLAHVESCLSYRITSNALLYKRNVTTVTFYLTRPSFSYVVCVMWCVRSSQTGIMASSGLPTTWPSPTARSTRSSTPASTPTFAEVCIQTDMVKSMMQSTRHRSALTSSVDYSDRGVHL